MSGADNIAAQALQLENAQLRAKVADLEQRLSFLQTHTLLSKGIVGETLVSQLVNGRLTVYAAMHDVETGSGMRLEVKYSMLSRTDRFSISKRWHWAKLFGESGKKQYDHIVLVGDADERYRSQYKDPAAPYVIFCIPRSELHLLTSKGQRPEYRSIKVGSNPDQTLVPPVSDDDR